jgi:catechol 2,3-dioxygenase-like lactoylglutathione lyase family enzyme
MQIAFDHVHVRTSDPEATAQWFVEMLGAEVLRSTQQGKPRIDVILGGAKIFIAEIKPGEAAHDAPQHPHRGLDHFGLSVKDLDSVVSALRTKGAQFREEPHVPRPGIKICFLRGPDDLSIELLDRGPKYA